MSSGTLSHAILICTSALLLALSAGGAGALHDAPSCPAGTTLLEPFTSAGLQWSACEDLAVPGGGIVLVPATGKPLHLPKSYEPYWQGGPDDSKYYLGLGKAQTLAAKWDMLGDAILTCKGSDEVHVDSEDNTTRCEPSWSGVEKALPPIRYSGGDHTTNYQCSAYAAGGGVRTFVGSRSASVDATFSDHADDCSANGFPSVMGYVMGLTAVANGEPPIAHFMQYVNLTGIAEGLLGAHLPALVFYFPILPQNFTSFGGSRYWTMVAAPVADMQGGREQSVWFRFQQVRCAGPDRAPPCALIGQPQYFDTYWFSSSPVTTRWIRPELQANASGFYTNLLHLNRYWEDTLADEGMMSLSLPAAPSTNGTWLHTQSVHAIIRSMISRDDTWHPRYGVLPGYGITLQDGFQDTFTSTATAALEWGAIPYAKGVIDNWLKYYLRDNGMTTYRAEELPQSGRMLTVFALYASYTGDDAFMLGHFAKARALGEWLLYRHAMSLQWAQGDPRHGIPAGGDEGDTFVKSINSYGGTPLQHFYSTAGEVYRGFTEAGRMWRRIGAAAGRPDVAAHARDLLAAAPKIYAALHASLNRTEVATGNPAAPRCIPTNADPPPDPGHSLARGPASAGERSAGGRQAGEAHIRRRLIQAAESADLPLVVHLTQQLSRAAAAADRSDLRGGRVEESTGPVCDHTTAFRSYPEMLYSGALTAQQVDAIYLDLSKGNKTSYKARPMTLGCTGYNNKQTTYIAYGMAYGLLQHDMVERFLLHWYAMSAHTYTRGSWTTPEAVHPDRGVASTDYVAAGVLTAPTYLKWALVFEEPQSRTVWLGKAMPRDWLALGEEAVVAQDVTTRYGRISFRYSAGSSACGGYSVAVNVTLPSGYTGAEQPEGGVRVRVRSPLQYYGKMSVVTVGGKPWTSFDAEAETVDFAADALTTATVADMADIVVAYECRLTSY